MKRIYSYVFAAVAMFAAVSCQKENAIDAPEVNEEAFAITAVANADTKTVLNGLKTYWTPTDALTTFDATGANRKFTTDITENSASARFTTSTFVLPNDLSTAPLLAVYPYTEGATTDFETKVSGLVIPATQQAVAGGFDPDATLAYVLDGVANQHNLKFNNVYGLFEFTVKNDNVKKVTVKANGGEKIAGPVELILNGTLMPTETAVSEVTLEGDFVNGSTYYVALIPGTYASGITVSFDDEEVKSTTKSITLAKNQIRGMGELEKPQPKYIYVKNDMGWSNVYVYGWEKANDNNKLAGNFPGTKMSTQVTVNGTSFYKFEIPAAYQGKEIGLTFNNSSKQLSDYYVTITDDKYLRLTPGTPIEVDPDDKTSFKYRIYVFDQNKKKNVNIYYWGEGITGNNWPGTTITQYVDYDYKSFGYYEIPAAAYGGKTFKYLLNVNGDELKTADLSVTNPTSDLFIGYWNNNGGKGFWMNNSSPYTNADSCK